MNIKRRAGLGSAKMRTKIAILLCMAAATVATMGMGVKAFTTPHITDQIKVISFEENTDYYRLMRECASDGSKYAMMVGEIYEEQRNLKIDQMNVLYEKTSYFEDCQTGKQVLEKMDGGGSKINRLKSEYPVAGEVYEYLSGQGWSDPVIAGVLGNMMAECGGQTLDLQWSIYGYDNSKYYGLCQWSLYYNPDVDGRDVTGQLDYLMGNIRTNMDCFGGSYDNFCAITDAGEAARYFCNYYERGAGTSVRVANAAVALDWIQAE